MKQYEYLIMMSSVHCNYSFTGELINLNFQENLVAPALMVARKHSLRSDALMSPHKVGILNL